MLKKTLVSNDLKIFFGEKHFVLTIPVLGLQLQKNLNWAPELLDLLHRLIAMTRHEFNSCFANLYRHGHDMCGWHSDVHPQLGRNPSVASGGITNPFTYS